MESRQRMLSATEAKTAAAEASRLIIEARILREEQPWEAARKYAEAAEIDNTLADYYDHEGQTVDSQRHRYSAMSCLAQAGNFYEALSLCHRMLDDPALQPKLRDDLQKYRQEIESLRENWYRSMSHDGVI